MTVEIEKERKSFKGLRVGAFESRMRAEMEQLIKNMGGEPFVAPSMREVPLEENRAALEFGRRLQRGEIDVVIFMTGVGARALLKIISSDRPMESVLADLKKIQLVVRGAKPLKALGEMGLTPTIIVPEPNTWREVLKTLDAKLPIDGKQVAVQEYGEPNKIFLSELEVRGAAVMAVPVYRAAMPIDRQPLEDLIRKIVGSEIDVLLFTNATQVENAMATARQLGLGEKFRDALARCVVASVGPTCSETLRKYAVDPDLEPPRPMMGALVTDTAARAHQIIDGKKTAPRIESAFSAPLSKTDPLQQSLFMKACRREKTDRTPIWLMRQAGRYMKEYRELRAKTSFIDLCKNPDLCSEVTVDAAHRLGVDAAIIFSDLLMIVEPLGFDLSYGKDQGPAIGNPFSSAADLGRMKSVDPEESLGFTLDAIRKTRAALKPDLPLIGFAGAPFTMASYIIEGKGSKNYVKTKRLMHEDEATWHKLLEKIGEATADYVNAQIRAGAQAIQIFDSWVGCLNPEDFRRFALPHTKNLIQAIKPGTPVISFGTQTGGLLPLFKQAGGDVIGIDWRIELDEAWKLLGNVAVMGNMDPTILLSTPDEIHRAAERILNQAAKRPGHIFNLGHGVLPETPLENVLSLIRSVKDISSR